MDTSKIRKFATEARNILKKGVEAKITTLGFDPGGNVPDHLVPQPLQGGYLWNGGVQTEEFYRQWTALYRRVREKGMREVCEEAAYTWFNLSESTISALRQALGQDAAKIALQAIIIILKFRICETLITRHITF